MPTSLRSRCIKGCHLALLLLGSAVVAHAQESPGGMSGGGTQRFQERMYQERIKELGTNQQQQGTSSQDGATGEQRVASRQVAALEVDRAEQVKVNGLRQALISRPVSRPIAKADG
jgi:hypothetical protein